MSREVLSWMVLVAVASILLAVLAWWLLGRWFNRPQPRARIYMEHAYGTDWWEVTIHHRRHGKPDRVTWWARWEDAIGYATIAVHLERKK